MGDTLNPFWGERLELQPWQPGEDLEFTVYDKGLIGAKTEGKVNLPSHMFYPNGFTGNLEISGLPGALLEIVIQPAGGTTIAAPASMTSTGALAAPAATYSAPMTYSAGTPASGMTYSSNVAPPTMTYSAGTPTSAAAPVMMMGPSATFGAAPTAMPMQTYAAAPTAMPMQTYAAPTTAYSTPYSTVPPTINTTPAMPMQTYAAPQTALPAQSYASAPAPTYMEPTTTYPTAGGQMFGSAGQSGTGAYKLAVSIMQAQNLKHLNHFTGDKPYVVCEVKHNSHHERKTKAQTKEVTIGDTSNPVWNEYLELEPYHPGEKLEFTIYDKGLLGSRTEGKAELPGEMFFTNPNGWTGALPVANHPEMLLYVEVRVLGPSGITTGSSGTYGATQTYSSTSLPAATFSAGTPTSVAAPVMTTTGSSGTYGAAQTSMPVQTTYAAPTTAYSSAAPAISSMPATANMMGGGQMYGTGAALVTPEAPTVVTVVSKDQKSR